MNKTLKAAKALGEFFEGVETVIPALEKLGKLEQIEQESESRVATLRGESDNLAEHLAELKRKVKDATERKDSLTTEAAKALTDAKTKAGEESLAMHRATTAECERILAEAKDKRRLVDLDTSAARKTLEETKKEVHAARVELQEVRGELAKLRERIGA